MGASESGNPFEGEQLSTRKVIGVLVASGAMVAALSIPALASSQPHYSSCTEAREAGAAPINRGEPGYRPALDRDDDGVACDDNDPADSAGSNDRPADRNEISPNDADRNEPAPAQQASPAESDTDKKERKEEAPSPKPVESDLPVTH